MTVYTFNLNVIPRSIAEKFMAERCMAELAESQTRVVHGILFLYAQNPGTYGNFSARKQELPRGAFCGYEICPGSINLDLSPDAY